MRREARPRGAAPECNSEAGVRAHTDTGGRGGSPSHPKHLDARRVCSFLREGESLIIGLL
jgi:hypothetical protein